MRSQGTLFFSTTRPGYVRAQLYDAFGRRVRTLMDEPNAKPGRFTLKMDGRSDRGDRLPAGMYFYRVEASEGRLGGRFVIIQ
jgi:flagellar hook assembly protein FlgD